MHSSRARMLLRGFQAAPFSSSRHHFERLEDRCLLAGDLMEAPPIESEPQPVAEVAPQASMGEAAEHMDFCLPADPASNGQAVPAQAAFVDAVFADPGLPFVGPLPQNVAVNNVDNEAEFPAPESEEAEGEGTAPVITDFTAVQGAGNIWTFEGTVTHANPGECEITFGGLLDGHSVNVDANGSFSLVLELFAYEQGIVSAVAEDAASLQSEVAQDIVNQ